MSMQDDLESMISALKQSTYHGPSTSTGDIMKGEIIKGESMIAALIVGMGDGPLYWCAVDLSRVDIERLDSEADRIFDELVPCAMVRFLVFN